MEAPRWFASLVLPALRLFSPIPRFWTSFPAAKMIGSSARVLALARMLTMAMEVSESSCSDMKEGSVGMPQARL